MDLDDRITQFVNDKVDAMGAYRCTRCGIDHVALELAMPWPDFAYVAQVATEDEAADRLVIDDRTFLRGMIFVPVRDWTRERLGIGVWIELDADDEHEGLIANQLRVLAPLLDASATIVDMGPGKRPAFELHDHPLALAQRDGIDGATASRWLSDQLHYGEPEPAGAPFVATRAEHGWELIDAIDMGRTPCTDAFAVGDFAKIAVRIDTLDADGFPAQLVAGWWVAVDLVEPDGVSGTLHSKPTQPTTLGHGTRMWPRRKHLLQRQRP